MISLQKTGNAIKFTFDDNGRYLYNGTIEVPVNSLTLVTDGSDMFTFKKSATNDIFVSGLYSEIGMTKAQLISFYKDNMVGGSITSGEVQTMIDESVSGKADYSAATVSINDGTTTSDEDAGGNVNKSFNYSDNVYYFNAFCEMLGDSFWKTDVTLSDGEGNTVSINISTSAGETDTYILVKPNNKNFTITAKGNYRITAVTFGSENGRTIVYEYKTKILVEEAVSTYVIDEINPTLNGVKNNYVSGVTMSLTGYGRLKYTIAKESGSTATEFDLYDNKTIQSGKNGLYVPLTGDTQDIIINTGSSIATYYVANATYPDTLELTINSAYTGSATVSSINVVCIYNNVTYTNVFSYDVTANTFTASGYPTYMTFSYDPLTYKATLTPNNLWTITTVSSKEYYGDNRFIFAGVDMADKSDCLGVLFVRKTTYYTPQEALNDINAYLTALDARVKALEDAQNNS